MLRAQREGVNEGAQARKCREAVKDLEMAVSMLRAHQQGVEEARKYQAQLVQPAECGKPGGKWHDEVTEFVILAKANQPRMMAVFPSTTHNNSKTIEMKTTYAHLDYRSILYCTNENENEDELEDDSKAREAGIKDIAMLNCVVQPTENKNEEKN